MPNIDPVGFVIGGFVITIVIILCIFILGLFGSSIIDTTDNPEIQEKVEDTTTRGIDTLVLLGAGLGVSGIIGLFLFIYSKSK